MQCYYPLYKHTSIQASNNTTQVEVQSCQIAFFFSSCNTSNQCSTVRQCQNHKAIQVASPFIVSITLLRFSCHPFKLRHHLLKNQNEKQGCFQQYRTIQAGDTTFHEKHKITITRLPRSYC